ncbi:uncharacterized protein LOC129948370 [Eupeodes corollae]|uniref:uncharacterized protein LOC129948370 n=1 Tax=Eupeodes corollae TaxID=290404 RepID=UPI00248F848D|nr:uncharacterized protein LOC129948370 [Eupeodes corollae]
MIVLSKIDYGIYIYGNSPKTTLKYLKSPYHQAARRSICAFPTSPIKNILAEAGLPTIEERHRELISKLVVKLIFSKNSVIDKDIHQSIRHKSKKRIQSSISKIIDKAHEMELQFKKPRKILLSYPPWHIKPDSILMNLAHYNKANTSNSVYCSLFSDISSELKKDGWEFIFTDGSKSLSHTSFAVTSENGFILRIGSLPESTSIFTAEAFAILHALKITMENSGKFIICSDSISVLRAINNPNNNTDLISSIRNKIAMMPKKIKLMWTPGHVNIRGNEEADKAANSAKEAPVFQFNAFTKQDLKTRINKNLKTLQQTEWSLYHHHYKKVNPTKSPPKYPTNLPKRKITNFVRLRLGHISTTHQHLLTRNNHPICVTCNTTLNISHILENCQISKPIMDSVFKNLSIYDTLKNPNSKNIENVNKFIETLKLTL